MGRQNNPYRVDEIMCQFCDYPQMLQNVGLQPTPNRLKVLEIIGSTNKPLSAQTIFEAITRNDTINRVTVYRILVTSIKIVSTGFHCW